MEMLSFKRKLPNILTTFRIAIIIPIFVILFIPELVNKKIYTTYINNNVELSTSLSFLIVLILFIIASITDFLDGFLARKWNVISQFGKIFDPIADKLLVSVSLLMLTNFSDSIYILIPSIIIICREILVSGLREFLATLNVGVPVTRLAKWKTAFQMAAITALLLASKDSNYTYQTIMDFFEVEPFLRIFFYGWVETIGKIFLNISAILTVITGYAYFKVGIKNM